MSRRSVRDGLRASSWVAHRTSAAEDEPAHMYDNRMISVLSGGRKRRRRYHLLASLWLATAALAGFVVAALVLVRI